jgi:dihydroorotate dehydrogenase electron transfer subunit
MNKNSAKILSNAPVSDCFFELAFEWNAVALPVLPGQFCTVRVSPYTAPLLRRPFAFSSCDAAAGIAAIAYKRRGPATDLLASKRAGDTLDVIGPLGGNFVHAASGAQPRLLVAGGTGFGPIAFLANHLAKSNVPCTVALGCRTSVQLPRLTMPPSVTQVICTDDGSLGIQGTPLTWLAGLSSNQWAGALVYACGPAPLLRGCHEWSESRGLTCFVSMEQMMACGVGACMGCAVKLSEAEGGGYARACTEGPVFDSRRLSWT